MIPGLCSLSGNADSNMLMKIAWYSFSIKMQKQRKNVVTIVYLLVEVVE